MTEQGSHGQRLRGGPSPLLKDGYSALRLANDLALFPYHLAAHRAHAVMLVERDILSRVDAAAILRALDDLEAGGTGPLVAAGKASELFTATDVRLRAVLGEEVGGRLHTGRSRNDLFIGIERMAVRELIDRVADEVLAAQRVMLDRADEHAETLFPGYTSHSQIAQPITFGHFVLGHHDALGRNLSRLSDAYRRANLSPLGGAAFAGTSWDIDRGRVAELLGFDGLLEHTADAAASRDFQLDLAATSAVITSTLSVLAESLIIYTTREFGYVELADAFADSSSIMPQKKNPAGPEMLQALATKVSMSLSTMLTLINNNTWGSSREVSYCNFETTAMVDNVILALRIAAGVVGTLTVVDGRARPALVAGFANSTDVADALVRTRGLSFGQAHGVVGRAISEISRDRAETTISARRLNGAARAVLGADLALTEEEVTEWLDPMRSVLAKRTRGGPAPAEVRRMVSERRVEVERATAEVQARRDGRAAADRRLRAECQQLIGGPN